MAILSCHVAFIPPTKLSYNGDQEAMMKTLRTILVADYVPGLHQLPVATEAIQMGMPVVLSTDGDGFYARPATSFDAERVNGVALHDAAPGLPVQVAAEADINPDMVQAEAIWIVADA
jgi:hypothetical protein